MAVVEAGAAERLARVSGAGELEAARAEVAAWVARRGAVCHLLTAGAVALGRQWDEDAHGFAAVTVGLGVLSALMMLDSVERASARGHALLTTAPGEQHSLGLSLVARALGDDGWCVEAAPGLEGVACAGTSLRGAGWRCASANPPGRGRRRGAASSTFPPARSPSACFASPSPSSSVQPVVPCPRRLTPGRAPEAAPRPAVGAPRAVARREVVARVVAWRRRAPR
jgi:hypothetical protein